MGKLQIPIAGAEVRQRWRKYGVLFFVFLYEFQKNLANPGVAPISIFT